jgi:hypothetical protein
VTPQPPAILMSTNRSLSASIVFSDFLGADFLTPIFWGPIS